MGFSLMKELKSLCKDDDTCIFVILVLIGFLLCMFFNRKEGYSNYSFLSESENVEDNHNYGPIGKEPTKQDSGENLKGGGAQMQQIAKPDPPPGMVPRNPGEPLNGRLSSEKNIQMARKGQQYKGEVLNNTGGINVLNSSMDQVGSPLGISANYAFMTHYAKFEGAPNLDSNLGEMFPMGEPQVPKMGQVRDQVAPRADVLSGDQGSATAGVDSKKEMKLVLFYAPWCGHSRNMIDAYDSVISQHDNKEMNGVTLSIIKVDMDANKEGAKPYGVDIKGFPTLFTFVEQNGKLVSQPFSPRDETGIIAELNKRTQAFNSQ